jgi:hypothetical protein
VTTQTVVRVKECDLCKAAVRIVYGKEREVAYDADTGEEHECFEIPPDANVLILSDDCDC